MKVEEIKFHELDWRIDVMRTVDVRNQATVTISASCNVEQQAQFGTGGYPIELAEMRDRLMTQFRRSDVLDKIIQRLQAAKKIGAASMNLEELLEAINDTFLE